MARCAIPLLLVAMWLWWDGTRIFVWGPPVLWLRSVAGSCSLVGTFYAFHVMPLTDIYTIANTFPVWVALLSWPVLGQMPSWSVWLAIVSSVLGVAIIQGPELSSGNYAALIVVGVSLFTAVAMMALNRLRNIDPRAIVVHFSMTALAFSAALLVFFPLEEPDEPAAWYHVGEVVGVGLAATFGQFFLTKGFTSGDAAKMSVATLTQFVFILALDVFALRNPLDPNKLWGVPLILGPTLYLMMQGMRPLALAAPLEADGKCAGIGVRTDAALFPWAAKLLEYRFPKTRPSIGEYAWRSFKFRS